MSATVHQLLPDFAAGDAIGGAVLQTQAMLRAAGWRSEIFANVVDPRLRGRARPAEELPGELRDGDATLYHLSIGTPLAAMVERLPGRRVIVYHNITPPAFWRASNPAIVRRLEQGRDDLRRLAPLADLVIGMSEFNLAEARAAGARRGAVVPPPVDLQRLRPRPATPQSPPLLVAVGRLAPNKRFEDLIRALAALRATTHPQARLTIAGHATDTDAYVRGLRRLASDLGVEDAVDMPAGRGLLDAELGDLYARAAVYVCSSAHEGFCVPLLEAMAFSVPVVAYDAGAVAETLGGAGIVLGHRDSLLWAAVLGRVLDDVALRRQLVEAGRQRLEAFRPEAVRARLLAALGEVGIMAP